MKTSDFRRQNECSTKLRFENMGLTTSKGVAYYKAIASRKIVKEFMMAKKFGKNMLSSKMDTTYLTEILNEELPGRLFFPLAKEKTIKQLVSELQRFGRYLEELDVDVLRVDVLEDVLVEGELIRVRADFILRNKDTSAIEVGIIRNSVAIASYGARKIDNKVENNLELYILAQLGVKLFPKENIVSSTYSLTAKGDKKQKFSEYYEVKKGHNIISCRDKAFNKEYILEEIKKIIKGEVEEEYNTSNCFMCSLKSICNYEGEKSPNLIAIDEGIESSEGFSLTDEQREAVLAQKGVFRINAGAGSGKTTIVALRVVELIMSGVNPNEILLITFTNKGAQEMKDKIAYWLKKENLGASANDLNIETFNSWGDTIIKTNYAMLGFSSEPELLEKVDKYDIIFDILKDFPDMEGINYTNPLLNLRYAKGSVVEIANRIDEIKAYQLKEETCDKYGAETYEIYRLFNERLRESNFIEYQDQVNLLLDLIKTGRIQLSYEYVIVDEFQDSDSLQLDLVKELAKADEFKSLMIVGDDSQSIFAFRNTSPENILNFHKEFRDVRDIFLIDNFRSTPEIIALANAVNNLNENKVDKELVSGLDSGKKPILTISKTQEEEIDNILINIKDALIENNPSDIAIIARTKSELFNIQDRLAAENIPFIFDIPEPLINNANIQMASSLIDYLHTLDGNKGIFEYLFIRNNGFNTMTDMEVKELVDNLEETIEKRIVSSEDIEVEKLDIFYELTDVIDNEVFRKFIDDIKEKEYSFLRTYEYITKIIAYDDPRALERGEQEYDAITLTTAHTSKGKEFNKVFVLMSRYTPSNPKELEEEIRVFFVAITRAKKELFISTNFETQTKSSLFELIADIDNKLLIKSKTFK